MDELKLLIEMVSNLPSLAVWVLAGYLAYKVAVVGSIYGVIRLGIDRAHSFFMAKHHGPANVRMLLDGMEFDESSSKEELILQLKRLKFIGSPGEYSHSSIRGNYGVKMLRDAIDRMCEDAKKSK